MNKRKLLIGLTTAGMFSAGFGAAVFPASAELRTLRVTLLGGQTVEVNVDVPPGTPLDQLVLPGITTPVIAIPDLGPAPAAATPAATTSETSTTASPSTSTAPATTTPAPAAGGGDAPTSSAQRGQATTGKRKQRAKHRVKLEADGGKTGTSGGVAGAVGGSSRALRAAGGVPSPDNPTFSFALPGPAPIGVPNFFIEKFRIPPFLLPIYQAAGIQYGIRWEVLAAINEIETDYGRNLNVSSAGAVGWMQFLPSTFKTYGVDANADGKKDPYNPVDAIFSSARYLKAAGAEKDIRKAVFSYNHADWYVDSVLMRARLIGGLPADLVGSLTGLTQGHFPVHATARYADDLSEREATKRVAKGKNASIPVNASATRRSIDIFAKKNSPVIAVQDGTILRMGRSPRLGKFVKLQDVYGNTYTYGHLKKLAVGYPVPKETRVSKAAVARELDLPKPDSKPSAPASAGTQTRRATGAVKAVVRPKAAKPIAAKVAPTAAKERVFANPGRPAAFKAGGQEQMLNRTSGKGSSVSFKSYFTQVYGLKRSEVRIKPLKVGSKVIAGTILGRIGQTSDASAPHVSFEIRPAGRGAPRIDPKPILDGWKLLESTAIYRAQGKNPFFGPDAKNPSIGQILLMSKESLQKRVLEDPRVDVYSCGQRDIRAGAIDRRVLATIEFLSSSGLKPTLTSLRCGHGRLTSSGNVSEHTTGTAMDIAKINGIPILGHQGAGSITDITIRRLLTLQGTMKPHQIISLMTFEGADNTLSLPDHADHIHVGFRPLGGVGTKLGKQVESVLKPGQWIKLIDRIGQIDNPDVLTSPSKYAIDAKTAPPKGRASVAHKGE